MTGVLVAGASGELGRSICRTVRRSLPDAEVYAGDRRRDRLEQTVLRAGASGGTWLDVREPELVRAAIRGRDLVIVATPQRDPLVQRECLAAGVHTVDVGPHAGLAAAIARLDPSARSAGVAAVAMAGLLPGLSGLLAAGLVRECGSPPERIDIALRQSVNGRAGTAGVVDMLRIVAAPVRFGPRPEPGFRRRLARGSALRLIDHPEREVLDALLGPEVRYWTAWDGRVRNTVVAGLSRTGLLHRVAPALGRAARRDPRRPENVELTVRVRASGTERTVNATGISDYDATAAVAAAVGSLAVAGRLAGAGHPAALTVPDAVTELLPADIIRIEP